MAKRASLSDRQPKPSKEKGRGVDALFESPRTEAPVKKVQPKATPRSSSTATFNLYSNHQNFLDGFVREGKIDFRKRNIGAGAINKSAVLQEMLELLEKNKELQARILKQLEKREQNEGSRHNPTRYKS